MLLQGSRQAQGLWQTDAGGNGFGDQLVQGADADTLSMVLTSCGRGPRWRAENGRLDMMDRSVILRCKGKESGTGRV